jgi:hypothetical protein
MSVRSPAVKILFLLLVGLITPGAARADDEPSTVSHSYSPYEEASIDEAAAQLETKPDSAPEGKIIEGIDVVTLDVIEPRDPAPAALNWLHATTRHYVSSARCCSGWAKNTSESSVTRRLAT